LALLLRQAAVTKRQRHVLAGRLKLTDRIWLRIVPLLPPAGTKTMPRPRTTAIPWSISRLSSRQSSQPLSGSTLRRKMDRQLEAVLWSPLTEPP
jgi:hypothetical protein